MNACAEAGLALFSGALLGSAIEYCLWRAKHWRRRRAVAKRHKSRITELVVKYRADERCNYWAFDEPNHIVKDPATGEVIINGYTHQELSEISRRRSEWGL